VEEKRREKNDMAILIRLICVIGVLSLGASVAEQPEPPLLTNVSYPADASIVKSVQIALRKRHYYQGQSTGFLGQRTGAAIERFQMDHGLRVKPVIDRPLLIALGIVNGPTVYH
jgi:peptidoglycan hydrolase-like protein with peptidoglycan-binding domain